MITVLLVEDEMDFAEVLRDLLELHGFRVILAHNGRDGLLRAAEEPPDVIVTDMMMPVLDGNELVEQLRASAELQDVPVIVMSATEQSQHQHFLRKPFKVESLVALIHQVLDAPGATDRDTS